MKELRRLLELLFKEDQQPPQHPRIRTLELVVILALIAVILSQIG